MPTTDFIELHVPVLDMVLRAELLAKDNPDVVAQVLRQLPLDSTMGHVVISGEAVWLPTRIVHLGRSNMVQRSPGAVYLYAPGQTICLTYGAITESAKVNKFGQVVAEDLPSLRRLGEHVWDQTVRQPRKSLVNVTVRRAS